MVDIDALETLAKAASQRKWHVAPRVATYRVCDSDPARQAQLEALGLDRFDAVSVGTPNGQIAMVPLDESSSENAAYIAAAQPTAILELTAEIRKLRTRLEINEHSIDGIAARDETIRGLEMDNARMRGALQTPLMTRIHRNAWHSNGFEGLIDARVAEEAFMDGAEKVLVYYGEAHIFTTLAEFMGAHTK